MVDFNTLLKKQGIEKPIDPFEIWEKLDQRIGKDYLRPTQIPILQEWFQNRRNKRDNIIKLHTGHGKTIIGLLILQSCLNEGKGPAVYICPNNYLVSQTIEQAKAFGINAITFDSNKSKIFPPDFLNSKAILVMNCWKMFNGLSIFGVVGSRNQPLDIGSLVMDDAHSCLEIMRESFSIRISRKQDDGNDNKLWKKLFDLFTDTLKKQGPGTYSDIYHGENVILAVPFWSWVDKLEEVLDILSKEKDKQLRFVWNLIKDDINNCTCIFSGDSLEISPRILPIHYIPSFDRAQRRFFLSATLTEDAFLIKDLNLEPDSVRDPLATDIEKYSGERLFIIPSLIHSDIKRKDMIDWLSSYAKKNLDFGIVAIVPSSHRAKDWREKGSIVTDASNLYSEILELKLKVGKKEVNNILTLANKYDGVDLPDDTCRILCLDSLPQYMSLYDRYFQMVRMDSKIQQQLLAQRIEQGIGRGVRGRNDWCIIFIIGSNLANFLASDFKLSLLSNETQEQIRIGADLADKMKEEGALFNVINDLIKQCLERNEGWKEYYRQRMKHLDIKKANEDYIEQYVIEREANDYFSKRLYDKSLEKVQILIDKSENKSDEGWYLQLKATYQYITDKSKSMSTQLKAHAVNKWLFIPETGVKYAKMSAGTGSKQLKIIEWIKIHKDYNDLLVDVGSVLDKICFGVSPDIFEEGINDLGTILGFDTQRPDKNYGEGPDNLWNEGKNYLIIECKNNVKSKRKEINKEESGQLSHSIGWVKNQYPHSNEMPIIVHPSDTLVKGAFLTDKARVLLPKGLDELKKNILDFFNSLAVTSFDMLNERKLNQGLENSKLTTDHIYKHYCSKIKNN